MLQLTTGLIFNIGENLTSFLVISYENGYEQLPENEKNIIKNKGFGHLRLTKNFSNNFYMEGFVQAGFNDFLLMERRSLYGLGVRNKLIDIKRTVLFSGVGFMSESETYNTKLEDDKNLLRSTEEGTIGIALNLESDNVGVVLMGTGFDILEGSTVIATGKIAQVDCSDEILGRVVNPLAKPIDGKGDLPATEQRLVETMAVSYTHLTLPTKA